MREVDVPLVRRNVGTLRHVAHVAEVAVLDDLPVRLLRHVVDFAARCRIDGIEQCREGVAEAEAAAATVANVEDARKLFVERGLVGELRRAPVDRVTRRRLEAAFAARYWRVAQVRCSRCVSSPGHGARARERRLTFRLGYLPSVSSAFWKRFAWERSAFASVSNQSAISSKPSPRAALAMPGYMSVYSCVSPAIAAFKLLPVSPIGKPVAGSPTASRYSRWPCAWPVSPSAVERNTVATSLKPSTSALPAK